MYGTIYMQKEKIAEVYAEWYGSIIHGDGGCSQC